MEKLIKEYLKNKINIEELVNNFNDYNKNIGKVYTPKYISDYIVEMINPSIEETVFEPSVGHGIFLFSLLEFIEKKYNLTGEELKVYFLKKVKGQDILEKNITELKTIIKAFFKKRKTIIEPNNLIVGNTLKTKTQSDIIIGNPPYIRIKNLDSETINFLRKNFISCEKGNIDLFYAFIEYAYKNSNRFSLITPNSWIYNTSAKKLRELIKENIVRIIDFKDKMIFKNADTYTSIFIVNKKEKNDYIYFKTDLKTKEKIIKKNELNDTRWSFGFQIKKDIEILKYHTPIATLYDKGFINTGIKTDTVPFYKLSKIQNEEEFFKQKMNILFPYHYPSFKIKEENELMPETLNYFNTIKERLNQRDKGKTSKYEKWYAYGRKQGLNKFEKNTELIIIPGMINLQYKFFSIKSSKIQKPFLFSSGFILEVKKDYSKDLIDFFNSKEFKEFLQTNGKVWKGKNPYYSISMTQIKKIFNFEKK